MNMDETKKCAGKKTERREQIRWKIQNQQNNGAQTSQAETSTCHIHTHNQKNASKEENYDDVMTNKINNYN